jgi:hypothetical protein
MQNQMLFSNGGQKAVIDPFSGIPLYPGVATPVPDVAAEWLNFNMQRNER